MRGVGRTGTVRFIGRCRPVSLARSTWAAGSLQAEARLITPHVKRNPRSRLPHPLTTALCVAVLASWPAVSRRGGLDLCAWVCFGATEAQGPQGSQQPTNCGRADSCPTSFFRSLGSMQVRKVPRSLLQCTGAMQPPTTLIWSQPSTPALASAHIRRTGPCSGTMTHTNMLRIRGRPRQPRKGSHASTSAA